MNYECSFSTPLCSGELWQCKTCKEWFCEFHWHATELGFCVECCACENERMEKDYGCLYCTACTEVIASDEHSHECIICGATLCNFCFIASARCPDCEEDEEDEEYRDE